MIYRLRYCNKDGVEARVDIQKGSSTPVIEVEGTERPFVLSYNNDKGDKSGMFLSSSADIEIYETPEFNINNLKTSNETELSVTHYINNIVSWQGFIIPDFFSIEVSNNPVITMTASDRLGTLKNVTLADLPSMVSLRELAILCLNETGLTLPLRTMADFNNGTGINDFFNSKILTQRLSDTKGRSISCYDILSSILTASNSFLVQRTGGWHIINKIQHEAGSGKLYTGATSFINWSDVIFNFSDISTGGRRTIIPVASTVGVFHEFGGSKTYPSNYEFKDGASGWTVNFPEEMEARFDNRNILGFDVLVSGGGYQPVYGTETNNPHMVIYGFRGPLNYVKSADIAVPSGYGTDVEIKFDINASAPIWNFGSFQRMAVFAVKDTETKALVSGSFAPLNEVTESQYMNRINFEQGPIYIGELARVATESFGVSGKLSDAEGLDGYTIHIRLYSSDRAYATVINFATINFAPAGAMAKGNLYKTERTDSYTKAHDIDTSLFADYITTGLNGSNGYFYRYAIDDTSSLYNSANELTSRWTAYNDPEQLPLLQHITRQRSRLFSVAHDLLSAEIEASNFDPLAIFVACEKRYTVVSAQFDFFKSNLSVELEEVAFQSATVRDFIYSYFGDGESGIKSIGGISGGSGGGSTGGGLTPEQLEILSFWKKDPDRENTILTEMNAYSKLELFAYGVGSGSGGGGTDYERLDTWADYDSSKEGWVLSALLGNDLNTRVTAIDGRVTNLENSAGSGSVTSVGISVPTGLSVSNSPITSSGVIAIGLQAGYSIPTTVKQGQWDTAYGWGDFREFGLGLSGSNLWSDASNIQGSGLYSLGANALNRPGFIPSGNGSALISVYENSARRFQISGGGDTNRMAFRHVSGTNQGTWNEIYHTGNLTTLSQLTDNIGVATHIANNANPHSVTKSQVGLGNVDNTADSAKNVLSASKLQTARTIWGQSFDGTGNVSGAITGATTGSFTGTITSPLYQSGTYNWASKTGGFHSSTDGYQTGGLSIYDGTGVTANFYRLNNLLILGRAANQSLTIDTNSNVSILGNTTTNRIVLSSVAAEAQLEFSRPSYNYITTPLNGSLSFVTNGDSIRVPDSIMILSSNGNVGIGKGFTPDTTSIAAQLHVRGNILATGEVTAYVASDRRLKENIRPIVSALEAINKLNPVTYNWNAKAKELNSNKSNKLDYGLIAQEVESVLPNVVHGIFDDKYKSIDYIKLIPVLIGAIKELNNEIDKLK